MRLGRSVLTGLILVCGILDAAGNFSVSASPTSQTVTAGSSTTYNVTITKSGGFNGTVTLDLLGLPSGATYSYNPPSVAGSGSSVLTVQTGGAVPGTSSLTIRGTSGSLVNTTTVSLTITAPPNLITYVYDAAGRLTGVTDPNGQTATYAYDAVGNLLSINRTNSLSIANFAPTGGPIGAAVTITGTGFSSTPSQNTVTFNGATAALSSATSTQLSTTVPAGATTGPISVTVGTSTVTSALPFTVSSSALPTITSFSPASGQPATSVTISGANFDPIPARNTVTFNGILATITSASSSQLVVTVPSAASSGKVTVQTTAGTTTSSSDFFIIPAPYLPSNMEFSARMTLGSSSAPYQLTSTPMFGMMLFDGTQGQVVRLVAKTTLNYGNLQVLTPSGGVLYSGVIGTIDEIRTLPALPTTGTYTLIVDNSPLGAGLTLGSVSFIVSVPASATDFSVFALPGAPLTSNVGTVYSVFAIGGSSVGAVNLSANPPVGATATLNPSSLSGGSGSSVLVLNAGSAAPGIYSVTVHANNGTLDRTTTASMPGTVPNPWTSGDVGGPQVAGGASYANGAFTVQGSGSYIFNTADQFQFVYQPLTGDATIVARVASFVNTFSTSKAGVMMRQDLTAGSANVMVEAQNGGATYQWRAAAGGASSYQALAGYPAPVWLKLVRQANVFSAFASADALNWVQVGSSTAVTMASTVYVGLAVSSENSSALSSATFDNVAVAAGPDFALSVAQPSETAVAGATANYLVSVSALGGFGGPVDLSASGLPQNTTAAFNPLSVSGSGTSTLSISTATNTPVSTSNITITGTGPGGSPVHGTGVTLTVVPSGGDFSLSVSPASQTVVAGTPASYTITTTALFGFTGAVTFSVTGLPSGATAIFTPPTLNGSGSTTLAVTASQNTFFKNYILTVVGKSGALTRTATVQLNLTGGDFSLSISPLTSSVPSAGGAAQYTVTLNPLNGFNRTVNFSVSGLPPGTAASFAPASLTASGTATLTVTAGPTNPASYTLTVAGTNFDLLNGNVVRSSQCSLILNPPPGTLAAPWAEQDIGSPPISGAASMSGDTFTVQGSGTVGSTADAFHFVYKVLSGDGTIIARVASIQNNNSSTAVGLMIREALTAGSPFAFANLSATDPLTGFQYAAFTTRSAPSASAVKSGSRYVNSPYLLKLARSGNTFTASRSTDGVTWVQIGQPATFTMAATAYVGFAVSNGSTTGPAATTAILDITTTPDFSFAIAPGIRQAVPGSSAPYELTQSNLNGFTGSVTFSAVGLPAGFTGTVTGTGPYTLNVGVPANPAPGDYAFNVRGVSGSLVHEVPAVISVVSDFSLSSSSNVVAATIGAYFFGNPTVSITVTPQSGFSGFVTFSYVGAVAASFSPSTIASGSTTMTLTMPSTVGVYPIKVIATSGGRVRTLDLALRVSSFTLSASPAQRTASGGSATYTITLTPLGAEGANPFLQQSSAPSNNFTYTFNPTTVTPDNPSTLTVTRARSAGTYSITIHGYGYNAPGQATSVVLIVP